DIEMGILRRRRFLFRGMQLISAAAILPGLRAEGQTCVDPASESLRRSLQYQDPAQDPTRTCFECAFFTEDKDDGTESCGKCLIVSGPVNASAWCESWSPEES